MGIAQQSMYDVHLAGYPKPSLSKPLSLLKGQTGTTTLHT